jgi:tetratricopeptide (TPR) repeat protein
MTVKIKFNIWMKSILIFTVSALMISPAWAQSPAKKTSSAKPGSPQINTGKTRPLQKSKGAPRKKTSREWENARKLFQAKNYKQAAVSFYQISKRSKDPLQKRRAKYFLAVSLYKMNMKQVAAFPFVDLVRSGEGLEKKKSFDYIVMIADELGEPSLLNYSLNHIKQDELSDTARAIFLGRLGEASLNRGQIPEAQNYFERALELKKNENSLLYQLAMTELLAKNPEKGAARFGQLVDKLQNRPPQDLQKGLAILGQARSFYQGKRWSEAIELYRQVPKDHPLYRQSLMELSWALFRGGQFRSALSPLRTLHTPFYENFYDPESLLLHGTILLFICHYDEIQSIIKSFDDNYYPAFTKIQEWLETSRSEEDYYLEVVKTRKTLAEMKARGQGKVENSLPFFVMRTILEEPDIKNLAEYLDKINKERKAVERIYSKTSLGPYGRQILEGRKRNIQKVLGRLFKERLETKLQEFHEFVTQFEFLKYEAINGQRTTLKEKIATEDGQGSQIDRELGRDYFVDNGYRFWPFEGEYWRDEIGNYQNVGVNRCEK